MLAGLGQSRDQIIYSGVPLKLTIITFEYYNGVGSGTARRNEGLYRWIVD